MLSQTLRTLDRDGLVTRTVEPTKPPQVTYALTPLGRQGASYLCDLIHWIGTNTPAILEAQQRYDAEE